MMVKVMEYWCRLGSMRNSIALNNWDGHTDLELLGIKYC
jgi:hypothetical protein